MLNSFSLYLHEAKKPTKKLHGLSVMSLEDFLTEEALAVILEDAKPFLGATVRPFPKDELHAYLGRTYERTKGKLEKYHMPYIHRSNIEIVDAHGKEYDLDALRKRIMERPKTLLKQNEKMQHSDGTVAAYYNIGLPALKGLAVNEATGEFVIVDTCPGAGACKTFCYAMKGGFIQYPDPSSNVSRVLNFLLNDPAGFETMLTKEIAEVQAKKAKKNMKIVIRWHDAGDFFSPEYLELAYRVARKFPNIDFYAYTKIASVAHSEKPANFLINFSQGAQPSQEKLIDITHSKHSKVVPKELFHDLLIRTMMPGAKKERWIFKDQAAIDEMKRRMAHKYGLQVNSIITYQEMLHTPLGSSPHWNVIVVPGDGDEAANRKDVLGSYLLVH